MDNAGSAGKKIVFKRRVLAAQQPAQEAESVNPSGVETETVEDETTYHYHGEIFDQFYRPLSVVGGEPRLAELALESLAPPAPPRRLERGERDTHEAELLETGKVLAHQIYNLAQKLRETDLDVYLSAFNVLLASRTCRDVKGILDAANEFFTEEYYTPIRDRGERPEIYHQIVKRVGHEHAERIGKVVKGLDVEITAKTLWDLYHGGHADKGARISDVLLDLTEKQVRAVREEFLLIPYKDVARQLHVILHNNIGEQSSPSSKRTIGKSEVYEQKRRAAFRSRDDLRAMRYLLQGRSADEVALIKRFYLDLGDPDAQENDISLEADVRRRLLPSDVDRAVPILQGWSPRREAEEIYKILYPHSLGNDIDDQLSDPRDSVDRDHTQGIGPYLRRFKKRRIWRGRSGVHDRTINVHEIISERVAALSPARFLRTNEALHELYRIELDPTFFQSLSFFDARRKAIAVHDRMRVSNDFFEIMRPIEYLEPRQCLAVQKAYECVFGATLRSIMDQRVREPNGKELGELLDRYINGHGRWPLNIDILARYRGEEPPPSVWEHDFRPSPDEEATAIGIAEILDQDVEAGELDRQIHSLIWEKPYDERNVLERAFFDLTDPHVPLRVALKECLNGEAFVQCAALLNGIDLQEIVHRIHDDPGMLSSLKDLAPSHISAIRQYYKRTYFNDLSERIVLAFSDPALEEILIDTLSVALLPDAFEFKLALDGIRASSDADAIRKYWTGPLQKLMALERSFDFAFPRMRVYLKYAAARLALNPTVFAEAILCFEGVDPDVVSKLLECFDAVDIVALQDVLRINRENQRIIEEAYDLMYPDAPLRRSIKEMQVDLDLINETLLHLEGYFAREVAEELSELVDEFEGAELGQACLDLVAIPTATRPNPRIPEDINWMDEMVYQVSLAYQRLMNCDLHTSLRKKGVPDLMIEELTVRIFGHEVCASARELFELIRQSKEGKPLTDHSEERICTYLETRGVRHRDRLTRAYNAFWAHTPGFGTLIEDVNRFFKNAAVKKKMLSLLLGVGGDRKAASSDPSMLAQ